MSMEISSSASQIGGIEDTINSDQLRATTMAFECKAKAEELRNHMESTRREPTSTYIMAATLLVGIPIVVEAVRENLTKRRIKALELAANMYLASGE